MKIVTTYLMVIIGLAVLAGCIPTLPVPSYTFDVTSDYGTGHDTPYALLLDGASFFVAGSVDETAGSLQWRVEKRTTVSGALDTTFGTNGAIVSGNQKSEAYAIAHDNDSIYVGGYTTGTWGDVWRVEKRDKITGDLVTAFGSSGIVEVAGFSTGEGYTCKSITIDATHIYIAGYFGLTGGTPSYNWRIEKRDKTTGDFDLSFDSNGYIHINGSSAAVTMANSQFLDGATLYVAGAINDGDQKWEISPITISDGTSQMFWASDGTMDVANSITGDSTSLYTAGYSNNQWKVGKRIKSSGDLDTGFGTSGIIKSTLSGESRANTIVMDQSVLYIGGYEFTASTDFQWRVEKRDIATGAVVSAFGNSGVLQTNLKSGINTQDIIYDLAVDDTYICLVGSDNNGAGGNSQWRIQKRFKSTGSF